MGWLEDLENAAERMLDNTTHPFRGISWGSEDSTAEGGRHSAASAGNGRGARNDQARADSFLPREEAAGRKVTVKRLPDEVPPQLIPDLGPDPERAQREWTRLSDEVKGLLLRGSDNAFGDLGQELGGVGQLNEFALDMGEGLDIDNVAWRKTLLRVERGGELNKKPGDKISARDYVARVNSMEPDELEQFQRELFAAGFYGAVEGGDDDEPMWGAPDEPTLKAVRLLAYTTLRFKGKLSITDVLDKFKLQHAEDEGSKDDPSIALTNPDDITETGRQVSQDLIGRVDDAFAEGLVGRYQGSEQQAGMAGVAADKSPGVDSSVNPASLGNFAAAEMRATNDVEVDSYATLGAFNEMLRMLGMAG